MAVARGDEIADRLAVAQQRLDGVVAGIAQAKAGARKEVTSRLTSRLPTA